MTASQGTWPFASRKRLALALYLDYQMFHALWFLTVEAMPHVLPPREDAPWWGVWVHFALFFAVEVCLLWVLRWSPGQWCLGIVSQPNASRTGLTAQSLHPSAYRVDPWLLTNERWWTVLLGVLAVPNAGVALGGQGLELRRMPLLLFEPSATAVVLHSATSLVWWTMVVGLCRLRLFGVLGGVLACVIGLGYAVLSAPWRLTQLETQWRILHPDVLPSPSDMRIMQQVFAEGQTRTLWQLVITLVWVGLVGIHIYRLRQDTRRSAPDNRGRQQPHNGAMGITC